MTGTYTIILEPAEEGGFVVTVPALPEVGIQGDTRTEAMANAHEAIELVIEDRLARGEPVPADVTPQIEQVTVAAWLGRRRSRGRVSSLPCARQALQSSV